MDRYKEERIKYEEYTMKIDNEKVAYAKERLQKQDLLILKLLYKFKICTSTQLKSFVYKDKNITNQAFNRRLKRMYQLGCIDRFFPYVDQGTPQTHCVLAPIGARVLEIENFRKVVNLNQNWRHTVEVSQVLSKIHVMKHLRRIKNEMIIKWHEDKKTMRVDSFISWIDNEKEKFAMIEVDMGTEPLITLYEKIKNYISYFNSEEFKYDKWQPYKDKKIAIVPIIIFAVNDKKRENKINAFINKVETGKIKFIIQQIDSLSI